MTLLITIRMQDSIITPPFKLPKNLVMNYLIEIYDPQTKTLSTFMYLTNLVLFETSVHKINYKKTFEK